MYYFKLIAFSGFVAVVSCGGITGGQQSGYDTFQDDGMQDGGSFAAVYS